MAKKRGLPGFTLESRKHSLRSTAWAFEFFGGMPKRASHGNLATAVQEGAWWQYFGEAMVRLVPIHHGTA